jgi:hypothetical protein
VPSRGVKFDWKIKTWKIKTKTHKRITKRRMRKRREPGGIRAAVGSWRVKFEVKRSDSRDHPYAKAQSIKPGMDFAGVAGNQLE